MRIIKCLEEWYSDNLTDDFRGRLTSGVEKVRVALMDRLEETDDMTARRLETMMGGGIRMHDNDRQELLETFYVKG